MARAPDGNNEWMPFARFLAGAPARRNPPRVTFVYRPSEDAPGQRADHAYWVSHIRLRRTGHDAAGTIDVESHGFARRHARPSGLTRAAAVLRGGVLGPARYASRSRWWSPPARRPLRDRLVINARNIRSITVHPRRARVSCDADIAVRSGGPVAVRLAGCATPRPG